MLKVSQLINTIPEWTIVFWRTVDCKELDTSEFIYKRSEYNDRDVVAIQPASWLKSNETYKEGTGLVITLA